MSNSKKSPVKVPLHLTIISIFLMSYFGVNILCWTIFSCIAAVVWFVQLVRIRGRYIESKKKKKSLFEGMREIMTKDYMRINPTMPMIYLFALQHFQAPNWIFVSVASIYSIFIFLGLVINGLIFVTRNADSDDWDTLKNISDKGEVLNKEEEKGFIEQEYY